MELQPINFGPEVCRDWATLKQEGRACWWRVDIGNADTPMTVANRNSVYVVISVRRIWL